MNRLYIIAEAGVNHNGSVAGAKELVDAAAWAGVDAVKFQTFRAEKLACRNAPKACYQKKTAGGFESHLDMLRKLELDRDAHLELARHCRDRKVEFLSSAFDPDSIDFLVGLDLPRLKIPSGEITNGPYLIHIAATGKPVILSTGMSTIGEIECALGALAFGYLSMDRLPSLNAFRDAFSADEGQKVLRDKVTLLHCTTEYPAPYEEVNLRAMETIRAAFGLPVGLSDHTAGIAVPIAAAALGAVLVEKHFTMSRNLPGPDHAASIEPGELKEMVSAIRNVEKALGNGRKIPASSELSNGETVRKSLVASRSISAGERFSTDNVTAKRPAGGLSPMRYWELIGEVSTKDYDTDSMILP